MINISNNYQYCSIPVLHHNISLRSLIYIYIYIIVPQSHIETFPQVFSLIIRLGLVLLLLWSFHHTCRHFDQVKFLVKIAAGYQPEAIIVDEANYAGAKWIVMDRSLSNLCVYVRAG